MNSSVLLALKVLIFISCFAIIAESIHWSQCGVKGERIPVKNLVTSPTHITRGKEITFTLTLGNKHEIKSGEGYMRIWLKIGLIWYRVYAKEFPLSKLFAHQLPIKQDGIVHFTHSIPASAPHGSYHVKFMLFDQDKREACNQFWFNM